MAPPTNSVLTALRVLERVSLGQPARVTDVAQALDIPKATAHRTLTTLAAGGWLRQDDAGVWWLTLRCAAVGRRVHVGPALRSAVLPVMRELSAATRETVRLWLVDGRTFLLVEDVEGDRAVRPVVDEFGPGVALHTTAVGKAVLATWPADELDEFLAGSLARLTDATIVDPDDLRAALVAVRRQGFAHAWGESEPEVGGVATVLTLPGDQVAALAVTFPTHRVTDELVEHLGRLVVDAARRIAALVGGDGPTDPVAHRAPVQAIR